MFLIVVTVSETLSSWIEEYLSFCYSCFNCLTYKYYWILILLSSSSLTAWAPPNGGGFSIAINSGNVTISLIFFDLNWHGKGGTYSVNLSILFC
jgi:hypothetical protein